MPRGGSRPGAGRKRTAKTAGESAAATYAGLNSSAQQPAVKSPRRPPNAGKGRKAGVPNKATAEIKDRARSILEDDAATERYRKLYRAGKLHPRLVVMFHEYGYGKPTQTVGFAGANGKTATPRRVIIELADARS